MVCKETQNETKQVRWIHFHNLGLEQALLQVKNLLSRNPTDFTYYLCFIIAMKNLSRFKAFTVHLSINFTTLESLFSQLVFRKEFTISLFLSTIMLTCSSRLLPNSRIYHFSIVFQKKKPPIHGFIEKFCHYFFINLVSI